MRKWRGDGIRTGFDGQSFEPIAKLCSWLFPRVRAITSLSDFHATMDWDKARVGIETKREKKPDKKNNENFPGVFHIGFHYIPAKLSRQGGMEVSYSINVETLEK